MITELLDQHTITIEDWNTYLAPAIYSGSIEKAVAPVNSNEINWSIYLIYEKTRYQCTYWKESPVIHIDKILFSPIDILQEILDTYPLSFEQVEAITSAKELLESIQQHLNKQAKGESDTFIAKEIIAKWKGRL